MEQFDIKHLKKAKMSNPIVIEGLPGIGNVGKLAADFIIESLKAKKLMEVHSSSFPHSVFVNEQNLVDLPTVNVYHKKIKNQDFLFIAGDVQPLDERSCYTFCETVLDALSSYKVKEIITLGGIGLPKIPKNPKVYATANSKKVIQKYKNTAINNNIFGVVGPIIGVSGLLVGLAGKRNIPAAALLAQTFGHPSYIGIKSAREIIKILNQRFELGINLQELDNEINDLEKDTSVKMKSIPPLTPRLNERDRISYIG